MTTTNSEKKGYVTESTIRSLDVHTGTQLEEELTQQLEMLQLERVLLSQPLQTHAVFKQSFIINQCAIFHFSNCHSVLFSHFPLQPASAVVFELCAFST